MLSWNIAKSMLKVLQKFGFRGENVDLRKANLGQLYYLARFTEFRVEALVELDRRLHCDR